MALTQHGINEGLQQFVEKGMEADRQELQKVYELRVIVPQETMRLNCREQRKTLDYVMFLAKKQNGTVKGRRCAVSW